MFDNEGLFINWLKLATSNKKQKLAIAELNSACGTKYKENWPTKMKERGYSIERIPTNVRRYMMDVVLRDMFPENKDEFYVKMIISLT